MTAGPPTRTPLRARPLPWPFPTARFLCGSWWTAWTNAQRQHTWRACTDSLVATDEPLSVMTPSLRGPIDPVITPEPGWQAPVPDWRGIPCRIGRVVLWLPDDDPFVLRAFPLLVLLPVRDPPEWLPYVLLGVQFLMENRAVVNPGNEPGLHPDFLCLPLSGVGAENAAVRARALDKPPPRRTIGSADGRPNRGPCQPP